MTVSKIKLPKEYFFILILLVCLGLVSNYSFSPPGKNSSTDAYKLFYTEQLNAFISSEKELLQVIEGEDWANPARIPKIKDQIKKSRLKLKAIDLLLRYFEPTSYLKLNGPLPVEWETEVFEKYEKPYRREGAGLYLAEEALNEENISKDSLYKLIKSSINECAVYQADSVVRNLSTYHHFYLANRLFLLNLAAIYTTGFECPDADNIIPELGSMLESVTSLYHAFDASFPDHALQRDYIFLYQQAITFVKSQPKEANLFDHFAFIRNYINPLFTLNQEMIRKYHVISDNLVDYSLTDKSISIFDKALFEGQNVKGIFLNIDDEATLADIKKTGKLLFYDPILSGNNKRSCVSCHKPSEFLTDTIHPTSFQFDNQQSLPRNTTSLVNSVYNHLIMMDGKHTSLLNQAKDVVTSSSEMGGIEKDILSNVLSCKEYEKSFKRFAKLTPNSKDIKIDHLVSAVILYFSEFSKYYSPFDQAMNERQNIAPDIQKGFNLFMSKAKCGTCHFVPQFNGVKPPYTNSEFEVLGVPFDTTYASLSPDSGRVRINPAFEMMNAFRTGTIRNAEHTPPYMHNGVFKTLDQVIEFYDAGGGIGKGMKVGNQTLSADSLKLSKTEKALLITFIKSLSEKVIFDSPPAKLPESRNRKLNTRKVGGEF